MQFFTKMRYKPIWVWSR